MSEENSKQQELNELQTKYNNLQNEHQQVKQQFKDLSFSHSALDQCLAEEIQAKIKAKTNVSAHGFLVQELQTKLQESQREIARMEEKWNNILTANRKLLEENQQLKNSLAELNIPDEEEPEEHEEA